MMTVCGDSLYVDEPAAPFLHRGSPGLTSWNSKQTEKEKREEKQSVNKGEVWENKQT